MSETFMDYHLSGEDGACPACHAEWVEREMHHEAGCGYLAWVDELDADDDVPCGECARGRHGLPTVRDGRVLCRCCLVEVTVVETYAPSAYDYRCTVQVAARPIGDGQTEARTVVVGRTVAQNQIDRYLSGMYYVVLVEQDEVAMMEW